MICSAALFALLLAPQTPVLSDGGFLPENDWKIPVDSKDAKGLTQAQFNQVLDGIAAVYRPIIQARGGVMEINRKWDDPTVNASTSRIGNRYIFNMYGGLARHAAITQDGFALVMCHELGHQLGGVPKYGGYNSWASNEGQSDYFANLKCLRKVFASGMSLSFTRPALDADPLAAKVCASQFSGSEREACVRGAMAGLSVGTLFQALHGDSVAPRFDTPDPKVVASMMDSHPPTQCRVDTYFQGSICAKPASQDVSDSSVDAGTCTRSQNFKLGLRPRCWYKPPASEPAYPAADAARFGAPASDSAEALAKSGAFQSLSQAGLWQGL